MASLVISGVASCMKKEVFYNNTTIAQKIKNHPSPTCR
ncbi:hypothetical protein A33Q_1423 [Indibacter alkaliphilus LW1]|uniref:Uncharacterized protein n=1 Tax=Indibacter alkaliphilus (strain CCUG 57479 / KCTC 22604 / LW1) TaxID=1189612 RepID=S2DIB5_INDAL|nr:hypothetical protein A33Q_1423 [Indibacter alkaliphilus LW1]